MPRQTATASDIKPFIHSSQVLVSFLIQPGCGRLAYSPAGFAVPVYGAESGRSSPC